MSRYLTRLGFSEQQILGLPLDIVEAARLYDGLTDIYAELQTGDPRRAVMAKGIAEGTRLLLYRIRFLVATPEEVLARIQQEAKQVPGGIPEPPKTHQAHEPPMPRPRPKTATPPPIPAPEPPAPPAPAPRPQPAPPPPTSKPAKATKQPKPKPEQKPSGESGGKEKELIEKLKNIEF